MAGSQVHRLFWGALENQYSPRRKVMLVVLSITPQCPVIEQRLATRWTIGPQASFWMKSGTLIIKKNRFGAIWSWRHCSANFLLETIWNLNLCKHIIYMLLNIFLLFLSYKIHPPWRECSWIATHWGETSLVWCFCRDGWPTASFHMPWGMAASSHQDRYGT